METVKKDRWYMTDYEIASSYRQAKNRDDQIHVIADLNVKSVLAVCDKLDALGFDTNSFRRSRVSPKVNAWRSDEIDTMLRLRDVYGFSFAAIGAAIGKTEGAVKNKYQRMTGVY